MSENIESKSKNTRPSQHEPSRSVFAPVVLISAGVFFLLDNLNYLPPLNWSLALRFWPLFLIFIGLNVLVVQIRRPWGSIMSLLVALVAVGTFGYLLLSSNKASALDRFGISLPDETLQEAPVRMSGVGIESAKIKLNLGNHPARIMTLTESQDLFSGVVWSPRGVDIKTRLDSDGSADVVIGEKAGGIWIFNPADWQNENAEWELYLNPNTPIDMSIKAGQGSLTSQLEDLYLSRLRLDGNNGASVLSLPSGDYKIDINGGNGRMNITLPSGGRQEVEIDGGNGGITLQLPSQMEAQVKYKTGNGALNVDERFSLVRGDRKRGLYQTAGYENAANRVTIDLKTGNGTIRIVEP